LPLLEPRSEIAVAVSEGFDKIALCKNNVFGGPKGSIEVDEQRTPSVLTNDVLGSKKSLMFQTDQIDPFLIVLFRRLAGWFLGSDIAGSDIAGWDIAGWERSVQPMPVENGLQLRGFGSQSRSDIEEMTPRLDPVPFGCLAFDPALRHGIASPASRPAPPGWA
jgi:hypothetical protein